MRYPPATSLQGITIGSVLMKRPTAKDALSSLPASSDSNWAEDVQTRKSTGGYTVLRLGGLVILAFGQAALYRLFRH